MSLLGFKDAVPTAVITPLFEIDEGKSMHNKQEVLGRTNRQLSFDTIQTAYKTPRPIIPPLCVYSLPR
jgi:hypothetical protein